MAGKVFPSGLAMAKVKPLQAIIYNQEKIKNLSSVVCPPYDIISPCAQQYFHDLSPYNLIHMLLGKDVAGEDKYLRAANYFKDWVKNKILIQDKTPAIYFYSQQYNLRGERKIRLGFICLLRLEEKNSSVFGHEETRIEPKTDRLRLLRRVKANLSPVFVIFADKKRIVQRVYQRYVQGKVPMIDIVDEEKIIHKLWRIDAPEILKSIEVGMLAENIFIADGHHRYEVACTYRDEIKRKLGSLTGDESFNYILAYFTNADSRSLTILPIHRLVKLDSPIDEKEFLLSASSYFDVEEIKDRTKFFFLMEKGGRTEHVLGMYKDKRFRLLRLKNIKILDKMIPDKPKEYRSLDVTILNHIILEKILRLDLKNRDNLTFSPHADELIQRVDNDPLYVAFFLNPVKVQQIIAVALNGNKMPPKSTYFYPKVLSGLVINRL